jgi:hypothetical protein
VRRRDPRPRDLAGLYVQPLRGDLRAILIKAHHDRHGTASSLAKHAQPNAERTTADLTPGPDGPAAHAIYQVTPDGPRSVTGDTAKVSQTNLADSDKESQPATGREPNQPAGQHRSGISLSLSDQAYVGGRLGLASGQQTSAARR